MPVTGLNDEPATRVRDFLQGRRRESLGVGLQLRPYVSTTFNMGGVAVVFGLFSMLILLESVQMLSAAWIVLSVAYFLTILTVVYFFLRAVRYSLMSVEAARRLGVLRLAEEIYEKGVGENTLLHRTMAGKFLPYGVFTKLYFIAGPAVLIALWAVIAFL